MNSRVQAVTLYQRDLEVMKVHTTDSQCEPILKSYNFRQTDPAEGKNTKRI